MQDFSLRTGSCQKDLPELNFEKIKENDFR